MSNKSDDIGIDIEEVKDYNIEDDELVIIATITNVHQQKVAATFQEPLAVPSDKHVFLSKTIDTDLYRPSVMLIFNVINV